MFTIITIKESVEVTYSYDAFVAARDVLEQEHDGAKVIVLFDGYNVETFDCAFSSPTGKSISSYKVHYASEKAHMQKIREERSRLITLQEQCKVQSELYVKVPETFVLIQELYARLAVDIEKLPKL